MNRVTKYVVHCLAAAAVAMLLPSAGAAQDSEDGVLAGGLRISPHLRLDGGYDSNVFAESVDEGAIGAPVARINPFLLVWTPRPRAIDFTADVGGAWTQFVDVGSENVSRQSGLDVNADVGLRLNASGLVSVRPSTMLRRSNRPSFNEAGDPYRMLTNEARAEIGFHPGGAVRSDRLGFSSRLVGIHRLWSYDSQPSLNRSGVGGLLELKWNFLPKTAAFVTTSIQTVQYAERFAEPADSSEETDSQSSLALENVDATPFRVVGGISGLITRRMSLLLQAGWGMSLHDRGESFSSVVGEARVTFDMTRRSRSSVGYRRDFGVGTFGNYFAFHGVDLKVGYDTSILRTEVRGFLQLNDYSPVTNASGLLFIDGASPDVVERDDVLYGGAATVGFDIASWFYAGLEYRLDARTSNLEIFPPAVLETPTPDVSRLFPSSPAYLRHQAFVTLDFHY